MPPPLQVDNIFAFIRQVAPVRHFGYLRHQQQVDFDLLTLKVVSESRVTWATYVPILVFIGLSVLELGPMYATDRRQTIASLNASALWGRRHNNCLPFVICPPYEKEAGNWGYVICDM